MFFCNTIQKNPLVKIWKYNMIKFNVKNMCFDYFFRFKLLDVIY